MLQCHQCQNPYLSLRTSPSHTTTTPTQQPHAGVTTMTTTKNNRKNTTSLYYVPASSTLMTFLPSQTCPPTPTTTSHPPICSHLMPHQDPCWIDEPSNNLPLHVQLIVTHWQPQPQLHPPTCSATGGTSPLQLSPASTMQSNYHIPVTHTIMLQPQPIKSLETSTQKINQATLLRNEPDTAKAFQHHAATV